MGILDEPIALAFDVECANVLYKAEDERENARLITQLTVMQTGSMPKVVPKVEVMKKFREQTF